MKRKTTIQEVRQYFENKGYTLLEEQYINNSTKMSAINSDGYNICTTYANFKNSDIPRIVSVNNPYSIDNINRYLKINFKDKYSLISDSFKGVFDKLILEDNTYGYRTLMSWDGINQSKGNVFKFFHPANPYTIDNIKLFLTNNNTSYTLLSKKYINNTCKLILRCNQGHTFKISWSSLQNKSGCQECSIESAKNKMKTPTDEAIQYFLNKKLIPLFYTFNNHKEKHTALTQEGYLIYICLDSLKVNKYSIFHNSNPYTIYNIHRYLNIINDKTKLISDEYISNRDKLLWKCNKNHEFYMRWSNFQQGCRCPTCSKEYHIGENSSNYNPLKTDEERMLGRYQLYGKSIENWRIDVFIRDERTCQCCGLKKRDINAHHIDSWNWAIDKRFDVDNGVTLCTECHKEFHKFYGTGSNTKEQYEEYRLDFINRITESEELLNLIK